MAGIRLADTAQHWMMLHSVDRAFERFSLFLAAITSEQPRGPKCSVSQITDLYFVK